MLKRVLILFCSFLFVISTLLNVSADSEDILSGFDWAVEQAEYLQYYDPNIMLMSAEGTSTYPAYEANLSSYFKVTVKNTYLSGSPTESWTISNASDSVEYENSLNSSASFTTYSVGYNQKFDAGGLSAELIFSSDIELGQSFNAMFVFSSSVSNVEYSLSDFDIVMYTDYGYVSLLPDFDVQLAQLNSTTYAIIIRCESNPYSFSQLKCTYLGSKASSSSVMGFPLAQVVSSNTDVISILQDILSSVNSLPSDIYSAFSSDLSTISSRLSALNTSIKSLPANIYSKFESTLSNIKVNLDNFVNTDFPSFSNTVYSYFDELPQRIADAINSIGSKKELPNNSEEAGQFDEGANDVTSYTDFNTEEVTEAVTFTEADLSTLTGGSSFFSNFWTDFENAVPEFTVVVTFTLGFGLLIYILGRRLS